MANRYVWQRATVAETYCDHWAANREETDFRLHATSGSTGWNPWTGTVRYTLYRVNNVTFNGSSFDIETSSSIATARISPSIYAEDTDTIQVPSAGMYRIHGVAEDNYVFEDDPEIWETFYVESACTITLRCPMMDMSESVYGYVYKTTSILKRRYYNRTYPNGTDKTYVSSRNSNQYSTSGVTFVPDEYQYEGDYIRYTVVGTDTLYEILPRR